jgi:NAD+ synthase
MKALVYGTPEYNAIKAEILKLHGVVPTEKFDPKTATRKRIDHLKFRLRATGMKGYVLGISGGVDSTTCGRMCQIACEELRAEGYFAQFIAVRLPAGVQRDEADAQAALKFINPDKLITVNVGEAANLLSIQGAENFRKLEGEDKLTIHQEDFNLGNIKCRLRMTVQYQLAAMYGSLVLGTDSNPENVTGFFCKFGDGAADQVILYGEKGNGVSKRQIRLMAKDLGAPKHLHEKKPMAGLESLNPDKTDDEGFGFAYNLLDDFLEGKEVDADTEYKIIKLYVATQHKRDPIPVFPG